MKPLLAKAKELPNKRKYFFSSEEIDLALGWMRGEINLEQVATVLGRKNANKGSAYIFLARALRQHLNEFEKNT